MSGGLEEFWCKDTTFFREKGKISFSFKIEPIFLLYINVNKSIYKSG